MTTFLTLFRYKEDVLDSAPEEGAMQEQEIYIETDEEVPDDGGIQSGISELVKTQNKKDFDDRWLLNALMGKEQSPEMRIMRTVYRLLLLFCLLVLLPTLYVSLSSSINIGSLNNLSYVISGKWEKGVNIFAFTSCIFLLCAMYVVTVLLDLLLYQIAKASDMRVETVCLLVKNAIKYISVIIFVYYGLAQFGVDTKTLLARGPKYDGVSSFEDSSVMIQISMFAEISRQYPATRALNREIKLIFDRRGIEIPFNQLVIHEAAKPESEEENGSEQA